MYLAHIVPEIVPELARGVSTALAIWATPSCPICPASSCAPSLVCPAAVSCPACICSGTERTCPVVAETPGALFFVWGLLCGVVATLVLVGPLPSVLASKGYSLLAFLLSRLFARRTPIAAPTIRVSAAQIALARRQQALETF